MIITLTLNPSVDRTIEIEHLGRGAVLRGISSRVDPGGKGVNVARALLANGVPARPMIVCGGDEGRQLVGLLRAAGITPVSIWIDGHTRSNLTLAEPGGTVTKVNEPGPELTESDLARIEATLLGQIAPGLEPRGERQRVRSGGPAAPGSAAVPEWVVISGRLPPGPPRGWFTSLCRRVVTAGARLAVDTSGPALRAGVAAGATLIKPNREELAEAVGRPLRDVQDVIAAAQQLRSAGAGIGVPGAGIGAGAGAVLVSLGADGAVLVDEDGAHMGSARVERPRSSVGAGDALLAGFLAGGARGEPALAEALAWAAAAVSLPGSAVPGPADIARIPVSIEKGLRVVGEPTT